MGTRGLFGFYYKGNYYVVYNHLDSYPSGLGVNIVEEIKKEIENGNFNNWITIIGKIKVVDDQIEPTNEDINNLKKFTNLFVSNSDTSDWYRLLRNCQGSLCNILESGYILNHVDKTGYPLFEEYGYIVNFDTNKLDFYIWGQKTDSYNFDQLPDWTD